MNPEIGQWYQWNDTEAFEVVGVELDYGLVEIQYEDGTVEELDIEDFRDEPPQEIESPL